MRARFRYGFSQPQPQHVTVALSGEGADELFGGYITYAADRYAARAQSVAPPIRRGLLSLLRYWPVSTTR